MQKNGIKYYSKRGAVVQGPRRLCVSWERECGFYACFSLLLCDVGLVKERCLYFIQLIYISAAVFLFAIQRVIHQLEPFMLRSLGP